MSEMIERVATAIYENRRRMYEDRVPFKDLYPSAQRPYLDEARAAIEAMREPTEEMIAAGARGSGEDSQDVALGAWEAMIDAALSKDSDHAKGEGE